MTYSFDEVKRKTQLERYSWWTGLVSNPIAVWLVYLIQDFRFITPNCLSLLSFLVTMPGVVFFLYAANGYIFIVLGVIFFFLFYIFDCMDGALARLRGQETRLGAGLDILAGILKQIPYMAALIIGGYNISKSNAYLFAGIFWFASFAFQWFIEYSAEKLRINESTILDLIKKRNADSNKKAGKKGIIARFSSFMAKRRLQLFPTDMEVYLVVFGIAPLMGNILVGIYIGAGYYLIRVLIKLVTISRLLLKEGKAGN